ARARLSEPPFRPPLRPRAPGREGRGRRPALAARSDEKELTSIAFAYKGGGEGWTIMATQAERPQAQALREQYHAVRALSLALAEPLSDADATIQPMPDASPAKWHLAH